ncbi:MAG: helicase-associated domain-containing protein [Actinomycetota bacterium]|jgi:hypothetical protein|nr:helicase-associated domain-containing protein [Actinomycetota bacterium]
MMPFFTHPTEPPEPWLEALMASTSDDLGLLLRARPDLALSSPKDLAALAGMMVSPASAGMFFEGANRASQQVLEALCALPAPATTNSLAGALGCRPEDLSAPLESLRRVGMVLYRGGNELTVNPGLALARDWPCHLGPPLAKLLGQRSNSELARIARRLGLSGNGNKEDLLRRLTKAISDRELLASLLRQAPPGAAELVENAAHVWPQYHITYGVAAVSGRDAHPVGWCLQRGLLIGTDFSTAVMPREAAIALRGGRLFPSFSLYPPQLLTTPVDQDETDGEAAHIALDLVKAVSALCEAWSSVPARLLQAGGVGAREVRRAAKLLARQEEVTARLIELAGTAGLVAPDETLGWAAPTAEYDAWKGLSSVEQWVELVSAWLMAPGHTSVAGSKDEDGKAVPPLAERTPGPNAVMQRVLAIDVLAEAGPGRRADLESVAQVADWRRPSTWQLEEASPAELVHWILEEAAMLGLCARGASSSFGRAIAGGDTEGAKKLLGGLAPAVVDTVILQADLTATATGEPAPGLRSELDLMADVESSGNATVWRFSEASLRRGFDAGRKAEEIQGFLADHAPGGVPQALSYLVDDLGRRYGRARVGKASSYVRCEDPVLLAEVVKDRRLAPLRLRPLAPAVAVSERPPQELCGALAKAGYLPASETADGTLAVTRPSAIRAPSSLARGRQTGAAEPSPRDDDWNPVSALLEQLQDLKEPGETDEELLAEILDDPDLLSDVTGLPAEVAKLVVMMAATDAPTTEQDLDALVERLRSTPVPRGKADPVTPGLAKRADMQPEYPPLFRDTRAG